MSKPLQITFDARMSEHTGIGTYVKNVLKQLSNDQTIDLRVICKTENSLSLSGRPEIFYCDTDIYTIKEQLDLIRYFPKMAPNVFFWSPHINIPLAYKGKMIVTVHDLLFYEKDLFPQSFARNIYRDLFFSRLSKSAQLIFTPSEFTKNELNKRFSITTPKTFAVHLGIGGEWCRPPKVEKQKTILFVGNLKRNKNLGLLIAAFNKVKGQVPHNLHIVGASAGLRSTEDLNHHRIDPDRIVIENRLSSHDLVRKVATSALVVCPSLYEGFGLVPLEAYAVGTRVLCSDIPVHREVMEGFANFFQSGVVESCAKEILKSLSNDLAFEEERFRLKFNWADCVQKSIATIRQSL